MSASLSIATRATAIAAVAAVALCAPAFGATRYAEPGGDGPVASCPSSDPCDIQAAVEDVSVVDGDTIVIRPGTYVLTSTLAADDRLTIRGAPNAVPVLIRNHGGSSNDPGIELFEDGSVLRDVSVESQNSSTYVGLAVRADADVTIERITAIASGSDGRAIALYAPNGGTSVLRDSVVYVGTSSVGIQAGGPIAPALGHVRLINVTAIAAAGAITALAATDSYGNFTIDVRNSILSTAGDDDFRVVSSSVGGSAVTATVSHSNFDDPYVIDGGGDGTSLTLGAGNQGAAPLFADAGSGDYSEAPGSPTIDAGANAPGMGALDRLGLPRSMGARPDIGAFEFVERCGGETPTIFGTSHRDKLRGTSGPDVILALGGNDTVRGLAGDDVICGGRGNDKLLGGGGRDTIFGQAGRDRLVGGPGHDKLSGGPGHDTQKQ